MGFSIDPSFVVMFRQPFLGCRLSLLVCSNSCTANLVVLRLIRVARWASAMSCAVFVLPRALRSELPLQECSFRSAVSADTSAVQRELDIFLRRSLRFAAFALSSAGRRAAQPAFQRDSDTLAIALILRVAGCVLTYNLRTLTEASR